MPIVKFGEWKPDDAALGNQGSVTITNAIPKPTLTYAPFPSLTAYSTALTARCQGGFAARAADGSVANFAGDSSKIYSMTNGTFTSISRTAGYTIAADEAWKFCQYGVQVFATDYADEIQFFTLGTSNLFQNLSSTAPKARCVAVVDPGFVMAGNTNDTVDGVVPNRVWWSGYQDPTSWPTIGSAAAQTAQSDFNDLPTGGWVQAITGAIGGAAGAIFCDSAIYRVDYEGPPTVFRFTCVERLRGTPAPNSVVNVGPFAAYLSEDGFYLFDGVQSKAIGSGKIDKTFYADLNQSFFNRIYGAADPINKLLLWAYPSTASTGNPDTIIMYQWESGRWSKASITCEFLATAFSVGFTLDSLDSLGYTLDTLPFSLDSRVWTGGRPLLSAFDTSHKLSYFTGSNLQATLETGEFENNGQFIYVSGVRPVVDGGTPTVSIGYRKNPGDAVVYTTPTSPGDDGVCPQHISTRYGRAKVVIPATSSWTHAIGVEPSVDQDGAR